MREVVQDLVDGYRGSIWLCCLARVNASISPLVNEDLRTAIPPVKTRPKSEPQLPRLLHEWQQGKETGGQFIAHWNVVSMDATQRSLDFQSDTRGAIIAGSLCFFSKLGTEPLCQDITQGLFRGIWRWHRHGRVEKASVVFQTLLSELATGREDVCRGA